jgi:hypothetical protein
MDGEFYKMKTISSEEGEVGSWAEAHHVWLWAVLRNVDFFLEKRKTMGKFQVRKCQQSNNCFSIGFSCSDGEAEPWFWARASSWTH